MNNRKGSIDGGTNGVYLPPRNSRSAVRRETMRRMAAGAGDVLDTARRATGWTLSFLFFVAWQSVRIVICIVLVFIEPVLRYTLVPFGFICFFMSIIVGFIGGASNFPKWGMLAFGIGCVFVYWLYIGLMSLFMELPRDIDDRRYR